MKRAWMFHTISGVLIFLIIVFGVKFFYVGHNLTGAVIEDLNGVNYEIILNLVSTANASFSINGSSVVFNLQSSPYSFTDINGAKFALKNTSTIGVLKATLFIGLQKIIVNGSSINLSLGGTSYPVSILNISDNFAGILVDSSSKQLIKQTSPYTFDEIAGLKLVLADASVSTKNVTLIFAYEKEFSLSSCISNWTERKANCTSDNERIVYYLDKNNCGNMDGMPENYSEDCDSDSLASVGFEDICESNWDCDDWSECNLKKRVRLCIDTNNCGVETERPSEEEDCVDPNCQSIWICEEWIPKDCDKGETQTRICSDKNDCGREIPSETETSRECKSSRNLFKIILIIFFIAIVIVILFVIVMYFMKKKDEDNSGALNSMKSLPGMPPSFPFQQRPNPMLIQRQFSSTQIQTQQIPSKMPLPGQPPRQMITNRPPM